MTEEERKNHKEEIEIFLKEGYSEDELTICRNCGLVVPIEFLGESELAHQDNICKDCMEEGYGS